jgi:hypothetical protein
MPGGDRTGPLGQGSMTGRAAGYCAGYDRPGWGSGPGMIWGRFPMGRGGGSGWGRGRGARGGLDFRDRFYGSSVPLGAEAATGPLSVLSREDEIALLKSESQRLHSVLETIEQRLAQIETM